MSDEKKPDLTPEELAKAAGGVRLNKDIEPTGSQSADGDLSADELRRASGGGIGAAGHASTGGGTTPVDPDSQNRDAAGGIKPKRV